MNIRILNKIELSEFPCKITVYLEDQNPVLEDKNPVSIIKKIILDDLELKPGLNDLNLVKNIDFFGYFKITEIILSFSRIEINLPNYNESMLLLKVFFNKKQFQFNEI